MTLKELKSDLRKAADPAKARTLQKFFKTGKGEYGEGDVFIGVMMPDSRKVAKKYSGMRLWEVEELLKSPIHEERLVAVLILVEKFEAGEREKVAEFYLRHAKRMNNWDLVDLSAHKILGEWVMESRDSSVLYKLAKSENLWERRIAIISTFAFIRRGVFGDTLKIAETLLGDKHDLMHKAVGWMLREVGKRDEKILESFLDKHLAEMPRTSLRYAVERLPEAKRKSYMAKGTNRV
jgi:3-methyladenine DNA glycosylase AlkD